MSFDRENLERLIDAYFDRELSPEDKADLDRQLVSSAEARALFWERARLHVGLQRWAKNQQGAQIALTELAPVPKWRWGTVPTLLSVAALLAVFAGATALFLHFASNKERPSMARDQKPRVFSAGAVGDGPPVAYLRRAADVRWSDDGAHRPGQMIPAGTDLALEAGMIEVDFYSGARAIMQGPVRVTFESDMRLRLTSGRVQMDVAESARGFQIILPDGQVTDLGTRFGVEAAQGQPSRVRVIEGEIVVARSSGEEPQHLNAGQTLALQTVPGADQVPFPADLQFPEPAKSGADATRLNRWRQHAAATTNDPSLLVYFPFDRSESPQREIRNRVTRTGMPGTGTVVAAAWSEGRWPGKASLSFRNPSDRVRIDIPGEYPHVTYLAWVKPDALPRRYNGLFLSEHGLPGEAHWQLAGDGSFMFGVRPKVMPPDWRFHRAFSPSVVAQHDFGVWRLLATTHNAATREVIHYVDGQEVHRSTLDDSVPIRFGRATLGNFFDPTPADHAAQPGLGEQWSFRNWTGQIDEFALFDRVLPADEIARWYEIGLP